ncbi:MAG: class III signal peptide [Pyrobaculum sp.]
MISIEVAILMSIILVIAVAVGWYLYTTFVATVGGQPRLGVVMAEISTSSGMLRLAVLNPGPVDLQIAAVEIGGHIYPKTETLTVGEQKTVEVPIDINAVPGTTLPGRVILSGGQSYPFTAVVKP